MSKVAILTDSSACLSENLFKNLPVFVIPLQVIFGEDTYLDGIDIHTSDFYPRLKTSKVMPSTSQPAPESFKKIYVDLVEQGFDVLSMHISEKLSGTMASALQAKAELPGLHIEVVDTNSTSMAMGFQVLSVAKAAKEGASLSECKGLAEKAGVNSGALFVVQTLEFLHRGGRIGGAAAFMGTALNLKPILELRDGRVEPIERVRTMNKAVDRLLEHLDSRLNGHHSLRVACLHADAPMEASNLMERIQQRFDPSLIAEAMTSEISPVIGTHTGPGTLGIAFTTGI
jgi:DegV family protein with EDD domain